MVPLSASELLDAWERGAPLRPVERALALLASARPDLPPATLAEITLGRRDDQLLSLREATFGSRMTALASCPGCEEELELDFEVSDIRPRTSTADDAGIPAVLSVEAGEYDVRCRLPTSADLAAVATTSDAQGRGDARRALLDRIVLDVRRNGAPVAGLPVDLEPALVGAMLDADPAADIAVALCCPDCGEEWEAWIDVAAYLWAEVEAGARRLAAEVHVLASAYGWREPDILALTPWRRRLYMDMVAG